MAEYFYNYLAASLGDVHAYITLKRNSVAADYQILDADGTRVLRFLTTSVLAAKGASYNAAVSAGATELYAEIRDVNHSNPVNARLVMFATDSPDNEYGLLYDHSRLSIEIYVRTNGTYSRLSTFAITLPNDQYFKLLLRVIPGSPNQLKAKAWLSSSEEPETWGIETTHSRTLSGGWLGHVGFTPDETVYYKAVGIGTNGDLAPRVPLPSGITLSVDSLSLSMAIDSATLTQANQLTVNNLQCQTSMDAVTLQQANVINPDEITLTSQLDSAVLVSAGQLSVNDLQLNMTMEAAQLQQANQLSVDSLLLTTTFESPDLSVGLTLVPDSIWLSALFDQVALTQSHLLTVDDLTQSISLDNVTLTVAGQVIGPGTLTIGITGPSISIGISP